MVAKAMASTPSTTSDSSAGSAKDSILAAALHEFSTHGYQGASLRSIGKRANVDFTLITYYFKSKENLWKSLVKLSLERFMAMVEQHRLDDENATAAEQLHARMRGEFEYAHSANSAFRLVHNEMHADSERLQWIIAHFIEPSRMKLVDMVRAAQEEGAVVAGDPMMVAKLLQTGVRSLLMMEQDFKSRSGKNPRDPAVYEEFWDIFERLFFSKILAD